MQLLKQTILTILFIALAVLAYQLYTVEMQRREVKEDLVELSKIKYGLFNVDEWKNIIASILATKLEQLDIENANMEGMREEISAFLYRLIDGLEQRYYEERPKTFRGVLQGGVASLTGVFDQMRNDVPEFVDEIITFLENPESMAAIQSFLEKQLDEYIDKTFAERDYTERDRILYKYRFQSKDEAIDILGLKESDLLRDQKPFGLAILSIAFVLALMLFLIRRIGRHEYLLMVLSCFVLLSCGLLLPMIEIDARIQDMSFTLLGESISFHDQILYYRSKSILEVVELMFKQDQLDVKFVGLLVLLFSVIFPVSKLISSVYYLYRPDARSRRFLNFMVFKTGKWSMADVMVVAIFMSYIGFSGIVSEQLRQLESITRNFDLLTTNASSLEAGFFLFTGFVVVSLLLAQNIQNMFSNGENSPGTQ